MYRDQARGSTACSCNAEQSAWLQDCSGARNNAEGARAPVVEAPTRPLNAAASRCWSFTDFSIAQRGALHVAHVQLHIRENLHYDKCWGFCFLVGLCGRRFDQGLLVVAAKLLKFDTHNVIDSSASSA